MELAHDSRVTSLLSEHFVGQKIVKQKVNAINGQPAAFPNWRKHPS